MTFFLSSFEDDFEDCMNFDFTASIVSTHNFSSKDFSLLNSSSLLARTLRLLTIDVELNNKTRFEVVDTACNDEEISLSTFLEIFEIEQTLHDIINSLSSSLHAIS